MSASKVVIAGRVVGAQEVGLALRDRVDPLADHTVGERPPALSAVIPGLAQELGVGEQHSSSAIPRTAAQHR
eukprot:16445617-Heterocapsa_arctica.AAC.1